MNLLCSRDLSRYLRAVKTPHWAARHVAWAAAWSSWRGCSSRSTQSRPVCSSCPCVPAAGGAARATPSSFATTLRTPSTCQSLCSKQSNLPRRLCQPPVSRSPALPKTRTAMLRHDSCRSDRRAVIAANALALWARALLLLPVAANALALSRARALLPFARKHSTRAGCQQPGGASSRLAAQCLVAMSALGLLVRLRGRGNRWSE